MAGRIRHKDSKRHTVEMEMGESILKSREEKGEITGSTMTHHRPEAHDCETKTRLRKVAVRENTHREEERNTQAH